MKKRLQTFLFWFILIQPFLDIYWLSRPPLLKFSIPTILRVLGVFIAIILFFSINHVYSSVSNVTSNGWRSTILR